MAKWEVIDEHNKVYSYQGFEIQHTIKIIDRRAREFLEGFRWMVNEAGDKELIKVDTSADNFNEAKQNICRQIDLLAENGAN